ncbi:Hemin transport protein HemS [compost metagenome]
MTMETAVSPTDLLTRWEQLRQSNPRLRQRNAAKELGVSEAELVAALVGKSATRLTPDWQALLGACEALGPVMALTRNENCVIEHTGLFKNLSITGMVGLVHGETPDILDLRIFLHGWSSAFALVEESPRGTRRSLQFFNRHGEAMHKVYLEEDAYIGAFEALVAAQSSEDQSTTQSVEPAKPAKAEKSDDEVDLVAFRTEWANLKDTHDFHTMVRKNGLTRTQALRLAGEDFAVPVALNAYRKVLETASETQLPIMIFVGNSGMIGIYTGTIKRLVDHDGWFNILDPELNLHLLEKGVESAYLVRKPTTEGIVTSLEFFDKDGEIIVQLFGKRKPGIPEDTTWRELAESLVG